jgi:hypothetical protein
MNTMLTEEDLKAQNSVDGGKMKEKLHGSSTHA